jgi:hypothetical protein
MSKELGSFDEKCYLFVHLVSKANNTLLNFLKKELVELKIFWNNR